MAETHVSRYERLVGTKPDLARLRAFGCRVEIFISPARRYRIDHASLAPLGKKLTDHATTGIHLGSSYPTPGYLVFDLRSQTIHFAANVRFYESDFPGVPGHGDIAVPTISRPTLGAGGGPNPPSSNLSPPSPVSDGVEDEDDGVQDAAAQALQLGALAHETSVATRSPTAWLHAKLTWANWPLSALSDASYGV